MKQANLISVLALLVLGPAAAEDLELRAFHVHAEEIASLKSWETEDLADLKSVVEFIEKTLEDLRLREGEHFFDVQALIEATGANLGESGFAVWNEKTRVLTVRGPAAEIAKLDERLLPWDPALVEKKRDHEKAQIAIEAVCVRIQNSEDPDKLLKPGLTTQQLLAGEFGEPELVLVSAVRAKDGTSAKSESQAIENVRSANLQTDPALGADESIIEVNLNYDIVLKTGESFLQTSTFILAANRPVLIKLGGRGTPGRPAFFLVVRAWVERLD